MVPSIKEYPVPTNNRPKGPVKISVKSFAGKEILSDQLTGFETVEHLKRDDPGI